ncbi:MAG: hypothetical protein ACI8S6_005690, partial [Myxococcota bacterium]
NDLPLVLERFADPKGMVKLQQRAGGLPLPPGARVCTGIAAVDDDGRLQLGSPLFEDGMLARLAAWVRQHLDTHPDLAHLSDARFVRTSRDGSVLERFADPTLWDGISRPPRSGTLAAAAATLATLPAGEDAWVWLSEGSDTPLAITSLVSGDPDTTAFSQLVLAGRARSGRVDAGLRGTVRRTASGLLVLTQDDLGRVGPRLSAWLAAQGTVRLAQLRDGEIISSTRVSGPPAGGDFSGLVAALESAQRGEPPLFWFTDATKGGGPLLLLEHDHAALKSLALEATSGAPTVRGQLHAAKWGLEFRTRDEHPGFLQTLAAFIRNHSRQWPGLLALVGARMTVRGRDGAVISRHRDDKAFSGLTGAE